MRRQSPIVLVLVLVLVLALAACSTPYRPAVISAGSTTFPGIARLMDEANAVDVVMVHGMCTHDADDARRAMDEIVVALDANVRPPEPPASGLRAASSTGVEIVAREDTVVGATVRFWALVWSGLSAPLKEQLRYDRTDVPNDCASAEPGTCKPSRARLNATLKDTLLNDCLADALVYQGESRTAIREAMVVALADVVARGGGVDRPIVLVSSSLGSKILYDALTQMLDAPEGSAPRVSAQRLSRHLGVVFMLANQLPILSLADQSIAGAMAAAPRGEPPARPRLPQPLQQLAEARRSENLKAGRAVFDALKVVAFTDPNDLLSYRLLGSRFAGDPSIEIADVAVSNKPTWFGLIEDPIGAHQGYARNPEVARLIACGEPRSPRCR